MAILCRSAGLYLFNASIIRTEVAQMKCTVLEQLFNEIYVGHDHASATISFTANGIHGITALALVSQGRSQAMLSSELKA